MAWSCVLVSLCSSNLIYFIDCSYVDPPLNSWDKSHLVIMCVPFYMLIQRVSILLRVFGFIFLRDIGLQLSLLVVSLFLCLALVPGYVSLLSCYNKIPQTRWLKQKFIFHSSWRLEVQEQNASRVGFLWGLSPWLEMATLLLLFHMIFSLQMCIPCVSSFSYNDTNHIGLALHPNDFILTSFYTMCPIT